MLIEWGGSTSALEYPDFFKIQIRELVIFEKMTGPNDAHLHLYFCRWYIMGNVLRPNHRFDLPHMEVKRAGKSSLKMADKISGLDFMGKLDQIYRYGFLGYSPNLWSLLIILSSSYLRLSSKSLHTRERETELLSGILVMVLVAIRRVYIPSTWRNWTRIEYAFSCCKVTGYSSQLCEFLIGGLNYFLFSTPIPVKIIQFDYRNIFQMGWFNHQLWFYWELVSHFCPLPRGSCEPRLSGYRRGQGQDGQGQGRSETPLGGGEVEILDALEREVERDATERGGTTKKNRVEVRSDWLMWFVMWWFVYDLDVPLDDMICKWRFYSDEPIMSKHGSKPCIYCDELKWAAAPPWGLHCP